MPEEEPLWRRGVKVVGWAALIGGLSIGSWLLIKKGREEIMEAVEG